MARVRKRPGVVAVVVVCAAVLAGCGSSKNATSASRSSARPSTSTPPAPTKIALSISAKGEVTGFPSTMAAGTYDITETPASPSSQAGVNIVRLAPGFSAASLLADVAKSLPHDGAPDKVAVSDLYAKATFVGGPSGFGTQEAVVFLPAGNYVYADPDTDGAPVTGTFTVTGTATAALPPTATTITARGDMSGAFTFDVTGSLGTPGMVTFKNASQTNAHFLLVAKLKPGKTAADCDAYNGDPNAAASPCTPIVDGAIVSAGSSEVVTYPGAGAGSYVLACYMPNPATGQPHAMEGMEVTKQAS